VKTPVSKAEMVKIPISVRTISTAVGKTSTPKTSVAATLAKIPAATTIIKSPISGEQPKQTEVIEQVPFIVSVKAKKKASPLKRPRAKKEPKEKKESPTPMPRKRAITETVSGVSPIPTTVKKKKLSEIDKLLGDEGAINMMYSLEKDNQNAEIIENMEGDDDNFGAKARVIRNVVINKSISPNTTGRSRPKRDVTPVKHLLQEQQQEMMQPAVTAVIGKKQSQPRKKTSAKKNDSWDFVYAQQTDDSMIIRRRSNSSYSSTSPRRLSLDLSNQQSDQSNNVSLDVSLEKLVESKFEFVKPVNKKMPMKLEDVKVSAAIVSEMKGKLTKVMKKGGKIAGAIIKQPLEENPQVLLALPGTTGRKSRAQSNAAAAKVSSPTTVLSIEKPIIVTATSLKEITIHHHENVVEISIKTAVKAKNSLTIPMMQEITTILNTLKTSNRCTVVLLVAKSDIFASGIDYTTLIQSSVEKRKVAAQEMCSAIR
jgi:chromodomain protein Y